MIFTIYDKSYIFLVQNWMKYLFLNKWVQKISLLVFFNISHIAWYDDKNVCEHAFFADIAIKY